MEPVALAYLAALVDGEGVITISRVRSKRKDRAGYNYVPRVIISNSHMGLVHFCKEVTGYGTAYLSPQPLGRPTWSPVHRWQAAGQQARMFCAEVLPYLVIKRRQAELVIDMPARPKGGIGERAALIHVEQAAMYEETKLLNQRGYKGPDVDHEFPRDHPALRAR